MAFLLSPIGNESQVNQNGAPLSGGTISTYLAGTSTVSPTFTDNTGTVAQTNPIILNTLGLPPQPIWLNDVVSYKFIIKDSNGVVNRTVDNITGVAGAFTGQTDQWVLFGGIPTFINATTFSVMGDQTPIFLVNRRTKSITTSGIVYSSVVSSAFSGGNTTVVLVNDAGVPGALNAGLTQVYYGILTSTSGALPADVVRFSYFTGSGTPTLFTTGASPNFAATAPGLTALVGGERFRVRFHTNGTGAPPYTLNINGLGAKTMLGITVNNGGYHPAITTTDFYDLYFDSSNFIVANPVNGDVGVGELFWWMNNYNPSHGILCNGAAISRSIYARLYATVGNFYGAGDGSTTFNVPLVDSGITLISTPGGSEGVLSNGSVIAHNHVLRTTAIANVGSTRRVVDAAGDTTQATDQTGGTRNDPAGRYARLCIRF